MDVGFYQTHDSSVRYQTLSSEQQLRTDQVS